MHGSFESNGKEESCRGIWIRKGYYLYLRTPSFIRAFPAEDRREKRPREGWGVGVWEIWGLQAVSPAGFCLGWALCVAADVCFGIAKVGKPGLRGSGCRLSSS